MDSGGGGSKKDQEEGARDTPDLQKAKEDGEQGGAIASSLCMECSLFRTM